MRVAKFSIWTLVVNDCRLRRDGGWPRCRSGAVETAVSVDGRLGIVLPLSAGCPARPGRNSPRQPSPAIHRSRIRREGGQSRDGASLEMEPLSVSLSLTTHTQTPTQHVHDPFPTQSNGWIPNSIHLVATAPNSPITPARDAASKPVLPVRAILAEKPRHCARSSRFSAPPPPQ